MGESACLMHSFSYASGISNEAKQGNPMHALGDSISFGRFMSESLSWEKWSTFSHKRYVEEAERYAQPGSVAQKKAFFEAHYKSIAAKKAAALLEQANAANNHREPELEGHDSQSTIKPVDEQLELKAPSTDVDSIVNENGYNSNAELETGEVKLAESVTEHEVQNESLKQSMVSEMEFGESPQMEKPLLEGLKSNHEKPEFSSSKPTVHRRVPKVPASPAKSVAPVLHRRENNVTPVTRKSTTDNSMDKNRKTPNSLQKLMYSTTAKESDNKSTTPEISPEKSAVHRRVPKVPASPAKPVAPALPRRENNITPVTRKSAIGDSIDRKRATPRSLHQLIYSSPAKESENKVESVKKATTPAAGRRIESSRVAPSPYKASKDCKTPLRTPMMAPANGVSKHPSTTPCSENKRSRTPLDPSVPGSKTTGPKWHLLSAVCSKSLSACRNKLQSPTLSVPFSLRTEERAARRKQKLEEKFNAKETPKVQLQTRLKEKAGTELRKLRQSFCFKARPLPDFYKERETSKDQINKVKAPSTHPQSPKLGRRKWSSSTLQGITSLPTVTASTKNSCPKNVFKTNSQIPNPFISLPEMMTSHENTSPNIQH